MAEDRPRSMPARVQLRRTKGWRKPAGAVVVARPSKWGNPFPLDGDWIMWTAVGLGYTGNPAGRRAASVALYRAWLTDTPIQLGPHAGSKEGGSIEFSDGSHRTVTEHVHGFALGAANLMGQAPALPERPTLDELRGHDLACWCPPGVPCHADVLLELANADTDS